VLGGDHPVGSRNRRHEAAGCDRPKKRSPPLEANGEGPASRLQPLRAAGASGQEVEAQRSSWPAPTWSAAGSVLNGGEARKSWRYKRRPNSTPETNGEKWRERRNQRSGKPMEPKLKGQRIHRTVDSSTARLQPGPAEGTANSRLTQERCVRLGNGQQAEGPAQRREPLDQARGKAAGGVARERYGSDHSRGIDQPTRR